MPSPEVQGRSWAGTMAALSKVSTSVPLAPEVCFAGLTSLKTMSEKPNTGVVRVGSLAETSR